MIIAQDDHNQRLDRYLKKTFPSLTFGQTQKLIRTGQVRMNGKRVKADTRLIEGAELRLPPSLNYGAGNQTNKHFSQADRDFITSLIIYEDEHILALNKPPKLAVQGGSKTTRHIDGMLNSMVKKNVKPRLVHRLDKDTSGVLLLAKSAEAARLLTYAFQSHEMQKTYWALTAPAPVEQSGTIDAKLSKSAIRHDGGEMMMHDPDNGKKAITDFEVIDNARKEAAFVAFYPRTGRTHQIRVHAALIGAPLLGDRKYNDDPFPFDMEETYDGLHLHSREIQFEHPFTGIDTVISAPLPPALLKSWKSLGFHV